MTSATPVAGAESLTENTSNSRTKHIRCCKPAVAAGLCRCAPPPQPVPELFRSNDPNACKVCQDIWHEGGHGMKCPRDSGRWGNG